MRKLIITLAFAAVVALGFGSTSVNAQAVNGVNCAMLANSPYMCIKNMTDHALKAGIPIAPKVVVAVQATSGDIFNPQKWIRIPGGPIMPGQNAVVKFDAWNGGCNQHIVILLSDNSTHSYPYTDVCKSTAFNVMPW